VVHPDRYAKETAEVKKLAHTDFKSLMVIKKTLLDSAENRLDYDKLGLASNWDENAMGEQLKKVFKDAMHAKPLTMDEIEAHTQRYKGSREEYKDLRGLYNRFQGNMSMVLMYLPCSTNEDVPRFLNHLHHHIISGTLQNFSASLRGSSRAFLPKKSAEAIIPYLGIRDNLPCIITSTSGAKQSRSRSTSAARRRTSQDESTLVSEIMRRQAERRREWPRFLEYLAHKHGGGQHRNWVSHAEESKDIDWTSSEAHSRSRRSGIGKVKDGTERSSRAKSSARNGVLAAPKDNDEIVQTGGLDLLAHLRARNAERRRRGESVYLRNMRRKANAELTA